MNASWIGRGRALQPSLVSATLCSLPPVSAEDIVSLAQTCPTGTGPFAATGVPLMNGQRDYMMMINERDGGGNGVRARAMRNARRAIPPSAGRRVLRAHQGNGRSLCSHGPPGITLQLLPRTNADRIPILAPGYGFSPMADGRVFKWGFNPPVSYWDGASMILRYISDGNLDALKGKKIALVYLDAAYGAGAAAAYPVARREARLCLSPAAG